MTNETIFIEDTNRWKQEPILNLANHFHKFDPVQNQQIRLADFTMTAADLSTFKEIIAAGHIQKMEMHLALAGSAQNTVFTACMYLVVKHGLNTQTAYFKLFPTEIIPILPPDQDSEIVPKIFKEMIASNWSGMDFHLIDDLFIAQKNNQLLRVQYYWVGQMMIDFINSELKPCADTLLGFKIYAGIDLNKFSNKETISFTPVLGFKFPETDSLNFLGFGVKDCMAGELFMEYSLPCPPTCPNG